MWKRHPTAVLRQRQIDVGNGNVKQPGQENVTAVGWLDAENAVPVVPLLTSSMGPRISSNMQQINTTARLSFQ